MATKKTKKTVIPQDRYVCQCCGNTYPSSNFYKTKTTKLWRFTDGKFPICKTCLNSYLLELTSEYGEDVALFCICGLLTAPYYPEAKAEVLKNNTEINVGNYVRKLNQGRYVTKKFADTALSGSLATSKQEVYDERAKSWGEEDYKNKMHVQTVVGYDPFLEMKMTEDARQYCYNVLAGYLDDADIRNDNEKMQGVIELTMMHNQRRILNLAINEAMNREDYAEMKNLEGIKSSINGDISKIAADHKLSAKHNDEKKTSLPQITFKMKEMTDAGYDRSAVNMFDIRTSEAMKQIADLSNRSIFEQLEFDSSDYSDMVKEQREMIVEMREELDKLTEENRHLKNRLEAMAKGAI